jgi:hypothetical protein
MRRRALPGGLTIPGAMPGAPGGPDDGPGTQNTGQYL